MLRRILFVEKACHLKTVDNQLVASFNCIKGQDDLPDKVAPIEDIGYIILEHSQISISKNLMSKLIDNNVALIVCNEKSMPTGMLLNLDGNTLQSERFKAQINASEPLKKQLWQQTVVAKIKNQIQNLNHWGIVSNYLEECCKNVKSGDTTNEEAKSSYYYWQNLFPDALYFTRKRDGVPPNNLLNYGYAILRACVARNLSGSGLLPTLGIFHKNRYNAYCLADDIMEPYRPFVDWIVRSIVHQSSDFDTMKRDHKLQLINVLNKDVVIEGKISPLAVAVQRTTSSLAKCFLANEKKVLYPSIIH